MDSPAKTPAQLYAEIKTGFEIVKALNQEIPEVLAWIREFERCHEYLERVRSFQLSRIEDKFKQIWGDE